MQPRLLAACAALSWGAVLAAQQSGLAKPAGAMPPANQGPVDYQRDIKPLLEASCGECHNGIKRKGGLTLATYSDILDGGKDGPIVRPGHSADSMLVHNIAHIGDEDDYMPPPDNKAKIPPLTKDQIALVRAWIDQGAK